VYPIDLQTILQVLANQSGELRTSVKQIANIKGECQVSIVLSLGKVISCTILQKGKALLTGEVAFRMLVSKGILQWEYIPASPSLQTEHENPSQRQEKPQTSPLWQSDAVDIATEALPVQARAILSEEFATWPRLHRFAYQLSTGDKTVEEIANLLSVTPERVKMALLPLIKKGVIILR
jgi:hypothetical protein